jgi:hypothetical protein
MPLAPPQKKEGAGARAGRPANFVHPTVPATPNLLQHASSSGRPVSELFPPEQRAKGNAVSEATCQNCGHPAINHARIEQRCELCAGCPGLNAPAPAARPPGYLWEIVEDRCRVCGTYIGDTFRFLQVGVCAHCAPSAKH